MKDEEAWAFEEQFWTGGDDHYRSALDHASIMAFPAPVGILSGPAIIQSLAAGPRWISVEMSARNLARPQPGIMVLGYRASGKRAGAAPYQAFCTSSYRLTPSGWKLVQHQQTPI
jgi:hypothetical protein